MDNWASAMIGRYILIVEDDYLIATDIAVSLEAMGAHILGPAASGWEALDIVEGALHLDGAAVDLKLRDGMAFPVAEALLKRGTPFVFATAYDEAAIPHASAKSLHARSRSIRCKLPTPYSDDDACRTFPPISPLSKRSPRALGGFIRSPRRAPMSTMGCGLGDRRLGGRSITD